MFIKKTCFHKKLGLAQQAFVESTTYYGIEIEVKGRLELKLKQHLS
jgi:hypothetical protein